MFICGGMRGERRLMLTDNSFNSVRFEKALGKIPVL